MLTLLKVSQFDLPLEDPVLKFLVVLIIILSAPLLLNKIKVPHLLGLIIAGAVVGPNGFHILTRDSSIVVTGTTGLLYIMFLAGLEIDLAEFKKNKYKSMGFGAYTFVIPFIIGIAAAHFILHYNWLTSFLFASIFSSHTLISYPLVSKLGVVKNRAVNVTVGGTVITDILALLVLAIVVGMTTGEVNAAFWTKLSVGIIIFAVIVLVGFPIIARWFFKKVSDKISQYIFVLVMIYLAALLAELSGIEAIIGAFLAGLALNKLIPHSSSLMNRVEFVGNAIFIPFFLISVGMLIDVTVFFKDFETIKVALLMITISIGGKYLASIATQKTFSFTKPEGGIIFGLSSASAAATLATVTVGYNIIIGETDLGEPIRLLDESVLNGSILLILISCTISSFVTQKNAEELVKADNENTISETNPETENILLAVNHSNTIEPMTNLALLIKSKNTTENLFALNIINEEKNDSSKKNAETLLNQVVEIGASADVKITKVTRYDTDVIDGINNVIKEYSITDLMIGIDEEKGFSPSFVYNLYSGYLNNNAANILVYHAIQPASTVQKYLVIFPENAAKEPRFFHSLLKVWNLARNSGSKIEFYGNDATIAMIEKIRKKVNIDASFIIFNNWNELPKLFNKMKDNDALILFMAHRTMVSYQSEMHHVPDYLNQHFRERNFLLLFPAHEDEIEYRKDTRDIGNANDFVEIGKIVGKLFK
ncbi:cation:proton antiporter [Kaistella flava (ex Peng et al. 2021)]|uniref:Cation:proton antiporter n=1 Tax=Kaistella flava (ex Peng et al. 2021) TaxID=2038776 RepID=A0A7M2YA52_9FLAO|nr:cation:proton antiporter [Kaistella flava (ex Peng et al. 2021)]QOW10986.1 cation:proton antiporter [Kaistella flava (ex Peng et al. 2021)]